MNKIFPLTILLFAASSINAQNFKSSDVCYRRQTQVGVSRQRIEIDESNLSDAETLEGIDCLLKLKGNKKKARFTGDTRPNYYSSDMYREPEHPATVEIAALYYISCIFYSNWKHAGSVQIYDAETEKTNSKSNVKRAYKSWQNGFEKFGKSVWKKPENKNSIR